jgi:hypothetical protein
MKIHTLGENPRTIFENKDATSHNLLMSEALSYGITDFTDADLTLFNLEGISFANCVFTRAKFFKTRLQKVTFDTCHMEDAIFDQCPTYRTLMRQCNLDYTKWNQTHVGPITMDFCTLKGANIVDLGMTARGYKVVLSYENGQAIIRGGCQELTLLEAKDRYPETNNDEEGARVTLARRIAYQRGWLHKSASVPIVIEPHDSICQGDPDKEELPAETPAELPEESTKEVTQTVNA